MQQPEQQPAQPQSEPQSQHMSGGADGDVAAAAAAHAAQKPPPKHDVVMEWANTGGHSIDPTSNSIDPTSNGGAAPTHSAQAHSDAAVGEPAGGGGGDAAGELVADATLVQLKDLPDGALAPATAPEPVHPAPGNGDGGHSVGSSQHSRSVQSRRNAAAAAVQAANAAAAAATAAAAAAAAAMSAMSMSEAGGDGDGTYAPVHRPESVAATSVAATSVLGAEAGSMVSESKKPKLEQLPADHKSALGKEELKSLARRIGNQWREASTSACRDRRVRGVGARWRAIVAERRKLREACDLPSEANAPSVDGGVERSVNGNTSVNENGNSGVDGAAAYPGAGKQAGSGGDAAKHGTPASPPEPVSKNPSTAAIAASTMAHRVQGDDALVSPAVPQTVAESDKAARPAAAM
eukprot:97858-Chlamydomonas_euryale.AAC.1